MAQEGPTPALFARRFGKTEDIFGKNEDERRGFSKVWRCHVSNGSAVRVHLLLIRSIFRKTEDGAGSRPVLPREGNDDVRDSSAVHSM
jgi:hypothetical protein